MASSIPRSDTACRLSQVRRETRDSSPVRIGYARAYANPGVLAEEQAQLTGHGCATVFGDDVNGAAVIRPGLASALAALRPGDTLAVVALDRLTWRVDELLDIAAQVNACGAFLWIAGSDFDTHSADGPSTFRALADFVAAVPAAREAERGKSDPRQKVSASTVAKALGRVRERSVSMTQAARDLGVSRATLYRRASAEAAR